jgi:hypothetical protein
MTYSVLTDQELLNLTDGSATTRREQVEQAINEADSRGWTFIGVDRPGETDASYVFRSADGRLRLGNIR